MKDLRNESCFIHTGSLASPMKWGDFYDDMACKYLREYENLGRQGYSESESHWLSLAYGTVSLVGTLTEYYQDTPDNVSVSREISRSEMR